MGVIQTVRALLLALFWPGLLLFAARIRPDLFGHWFDVIELVAAALAAAGGLIAAGFARWRLTAAFALTMLAWAGLRFHGMPATMTLLPILALAVVPWFREGGITGAPVLGTVAVAIVTGALWLRGGPPAAEVDSLLQITVRAGPVVASISALLTAVGLAVLAIRLLWLRQALDVGLTGALAAMLTIPMPWATNALAAVAGAVLALWTGLLLHAWRMAFLDQLTGLPNRRALEDQLKALPGRWSLAMLDVDHFKKFNDRFGHDVGDQVLRRVAAALMTVGERGKPFRYGGEEFSVVFPHDDLERAERAIEAIRERIENTPFHVRGPRQGPKARGKGKGQGAQKITISAGLTAANGDKAPVTFKRADKALYKAKAQGRNRVVTSR